MKTIIKAKNNFKFCFYITCFFISGISYSEENKLLILNDYFEYLEKKIVLLEKISFSQSQLLQSLQKQISNNKEDIKILRGKIQENSYKLKKIFEKKKLY